MSIILLSFLSPRFYFAFVLLNYYSAFFKAQPLEKMAQGSQMVLSNGISDSKRVEECGVGRLLFQSYRPDIIMAVTVMTGDADDWKLVSSYYSIISGEFSSSSLS